MEEKQIEEIRCENCIHHFACRLNGEYEPSPCRAYEDKAGYRKQSEGEWKLGKSGCMYFCSCCGYAAHPREEEEWNYCPNCGHPMKGGEG